ncbi:hypothetical protein N7501_006988 [Penicillium viridicatum]|nr:hypothetical protein N7501_006988 [Penicillium viridicatum]
MALSSKCKQFFMKNKLLRAEIILDRANQTFMPGDAVWGSVKIVVLQDIEIAEAYVSIEGRNFIEIQRAGMGSAQGAVVTSEERIFLKTEEKLIGNQELPAKFITKGQSELLAFKLKIPLRLDRVCSHSVDNDGLRDEHRLLPPCLSIGGPDTVEIQYSISFVSKGRPMLSLHSSFTIQAVARQSITVVPGSRLRPCLFSEVQ